MAPRPMHPALGPDHWRDRAAQTQTVARWMKNEQAKRLLYEIAERYEQIATLAEAGLISFSGAADDRE